MAGQRRAHLSRQRKHISLATFSSDQDFTRPPPEVPQFQQKHFAGAKPQFCQQEQDRKITASSEGGPVYRTQDAINLLGCQLSGNTGLGPSAHGRDRGSQIVADLTVCVKKSQKGPETRGQQSNRLAGSSLRALKKKATQHTRVQPTDGSVAMLFLQVAKQEGNHRQIDPEGKLCQTFFVAEEVGITSFQGRTGCLRRIRHTGGNRPLVAQVLQEGR
jgi:hypothetical protein